MKLVRITLLASALAAAVAAQTRPPDLQTREEAYRANNLGVARLEQFNYRAAADAFRQSLRMNPSLTLARVNLAIALFYLPDLDEAERQATDAAGLLPNNPRPPYMLGLIARARGRDELARTAFTRVLEIDPRDVGTRLNLGQIDLQDRRYSQAIEAFRAALVEEPYSVTAEYNLGLALTRAGREEEGRQAIARSQALRAAGYGIVFSTQYLEQGRYAEAIASTGAEPELVDRAVPAVTFTRPAVAATTVRASSGPSSSPFGRAFGAEDLSDNGRRIADALGGGVTLLDFDGDGTTDVFVVWPDGVRLFKNDRGVFHDVTADSGLAGATGGIAAVAGDYDNDGLPDLLVLRYGGNVLYHNDGNGRFSDVTAKSGLPRYPFLSVSAAFVDFDHDGDLDIVIAGLADLTSASDRATGRQLVFPDDFDGAPVQLVRNNGNGTFTDITAQTGIAGVSHAIAVVPTDYDNHRDIDLLIVNHDRPPALFKNLRDGTFRDVAAETGLRVDGRITAVAAADINKDDFPDFFFGRAGAPGVFALSDGLGRYTLVQAPAASADATAAQFLDYDNDGLLDLLTWSAGGPHLFRHLSEDWMDVTARALPGTAGSDSSGAVSASALGLADIDGDGAIDVVSSRAPGAVELWHNNGASRARSVRVRLNGRASNRRGVGAKIDIRAGSLRQRLETSAATPAVAPADVLFGLERRSGADVVRVLWPSGILQAETSVASPMTITELDRKPSSCPFLYTWNGTRFEFVTDFMGAGEMGYWESPQERNVPNPDEYVRIRGDQLQARDGRYDLRVTNELEETLFVDRLELLAVTHPADVAIFPNEGMTDPPKPFRLYAARDWRPPVRAVDDHGHDITDRIAHLDRQYPDEFSLLPFRGYAAPHTLTLTLSRADQPTLLLLTGWTDYAFSSDNIAAHQAGLALQPPRLEVREADGTWRTLVADMGVPVGRPQTIVVDLGPRLPSADVRIVTNMRIYWDQILVATPAQGAVAAGARIDRLDPIRAQLHWRGFSAEAARQPPTYDYDRVTSDSPWKVMPGRYTREGDVRALLMRIDNQFVIMRPGDEIAVSFDATHLEPTPAGSARTFLLFADGYSKEMDINSASPDQVEPLPYHGMTRYPYAPPEHFPDTPALRRYRSQYNTRIVARPLPSLDLTAERH